MKEYKGIAHALKGVHVPPRPLKRRITQPKKHLRVLYDQSILGLLSEDEQKAIMLIKKFGCSHIAEVLKCSKQYVSKELDTLIQKAIDLSISKL